MYETIHTLENGGMPREEIMNMSPESIRNKLAEIESVILQNKVELAKELLADWEIAKNDSQFVYSDFEGSTSLQHVDDIIDSVKANDWGSFTGLLVGDTIPVVYEIACRPDGQLLLTRYSGMEEVEVRQSAITDVFTTETFYHFTNQKDVFFSIPRVALTETEEVDGYPNDSVFKATVTAKQAEEKAAQISALLQAYFSYVWERDGGNAMNGYGIVIPHGFASQAANEPDREAVADGTARILGKY